MDLVKLAAELKTIFPSCEVSTKGISILISLPDVPDQALEEEVPIAQSITIEPANNGHALNLTINYNLNENDHGHIQDYIAEVLLPDDNPVRASGVIFAALAAYYADGDLGEGDAVNLCTLLTNAGKR